MLRVKNSSFGVTPSSLRSSWKVHARTTAMTTRMARSRNLYLDIGRAEYPNRSLDIKFSRKKGRRSSHERDLGGSSLTN